MNIKTFVEGALSTNSYIVSNNDECILIDPQGNGNDFLEYISNNSLKPLAILLTHGHFDHIGAVNALKSALTIPVYASIHEKELLATPSLNLSRMIGKKLSIQANYYFQSNEVLQIGSFEVKTIETPGHTIGSVCYLIDTHLFSGDTLFKESYGRYNFPTGSFSSLRNSITTLLSLPQDYSVYPGHGDSTTLKHERSFNPLAQ